MPPAVHDHIWREVTQLRITTVVYNYVGCVFVCGLEDAGCKWLPLRRPPAQEMLHVQQVASTSSLGLYDIIVLPF